VRTTARHTFFFTKDDVFSNWYPSPFEVDGNRFSCMEQWMMYQKADLFGDSVTARKILATHDPAEHKKLGREVKGFEKVLWDTEGTERIYLGLLEKFRQNPDQLEELLATGDTGLVEASPYDRIWGIGLAENAPGVDDPANWKGENRLGNLLNRARDELRNELDHTPRASRVPGL
jgi:ribA/ribD-fused uncharacterized protein